jgi:hypothetical protein
MLPIEQVQPLDQQNQRASWELLQQYASRCKDLVSTGLVGEAGGIQLLKQLLLEFLPLEQQTSLQAWTCATSSTLAFNTTGTTNHKRHNSSSSSNSSNSNSKQTNNNIILSRPWSNGVQALILPIELGTLSIIEAHRLYSLVLLWLEGIARWDMTHATLQRIRQQQQHLVDWIIVREHMLSQVFHGKHGGASGTLVMSIVPAWLRSDLNTHFHDAREYTYTTHQLQQCQTHDLVWNAIQHRLVASGHLHAPLLVYWLRAILLWWQAEPSTAVDAALCVAQGPMAFAVEQLRTHWVLGGVAQLAQLVADALCCTTFHWNRALYYSTAEPTAGFHRMVLGRLRAMPSTELFQAVSEHELAKFLQAFTSAINQPPSS